jgi:hypothetical protein
MKADGKSQIRVGEMKPKAIEAIESRGWKFEDGVVIFDQAAPSKKGYAVRHDPVRSGGKSLGASSSPVTVTKKKLSKKDKLRAHLLAGESVSVHVSMKLWGLNALAQRCTELRAEGLDIVTDIRKGKDNDRFALYYLKKFEHKFKQ